MKHALSVTGILNALAVAGLIAGCTNSDSATAPVTTEMTEDFDHDHTHQHSDHADHEHHHDDGFQGEHAHGHSHSHRHGEPLHGGRIVSIGHTHHGKGATHFHAEVMPIVEDTIRFHLLTESDEGKSIDLAIEQTEIPGIISIKSAESVSVDCVFKGTGDGDESSEFFLKIPERLTRGEAFSVVIPKLTVRGHRQNFSFTAKRSDHGHSHEHDDDHAHGDHEHEDGDDRAHDKATAQDQPSDAEKADASGDNSAETSENDAVNSKAASTEESGNE